MTVTVASNIIELKLRIVIEFAPLEVPSPPTIMFFCPVSCGETAPEFVWAAEPEASPLPLFPSAYWPGRTDVPVAAVVLVDEITDPALLALALFEVTAPELLGIADPALLELEPFVLADPGLLVWS